MTRRDLLRALLAIPAMAALDVEQLLWVPKPIIVVPAMPMFGRHIIGEEVARAWEKIVGNRLYDNVFERDLFVSLLEKQAVT
jgi:hypothetical protein